MKRFNKQLKAQAAAELAILGSLILIGFSMILSYAQRLDNMQKIKQQAFRNALVKSYQRNATVTYTKKKDMFGVDFLSLQQRPQTMSASSTVMWQKGVAGNPGEEIPIINAKGEEEWVESSSLDGGGFAYYDINDVIVGSDRFGLPRYTRTVPQGDDAQTIANPVQVWRQTLLKRRSSSDTLLAKEERDNQIGTRREKTMRDEVHGAVFYRRDTRDTIPAEDDGSDAVYENLGRDNYVLYLYDRGKAYNQGQWSPEEISMYGEDRLSYTDDPATDCPGGDCYVRTSRDWITSD